MPSVSASVAAEARAEAEQMRSHNCRKPIVGRRHHRRSVPDRGVLERSVGRISSAVCRVGR